MASISEFKAAFSSGLVRQHKFEIIFTFPTLAGTTDAARNASLLARSGQVPSFNTGVIPVMYAGREIPVPGDRTFEEFTCSFYATNLWDVRDAFERWQEIMNGSESNTGSILSTDYERDIQVNLLDGDGNVRKTYVLNDAWPTVVGAGDLDQASQDSVMEFPVTFRYTNLSSNTTR